MTENTPTPAELARLDIVKLGRTAQELHVLVADPMPNGTVLAKQLSTGVVRSVRVERCIRVGRHTDRIERETQR